MICWICLLSVLMAEGLRSDMTTVEVEMAVGLPTSKLARGDRAIWNYPDGGQVVFEAGRVVSLKNMPLASEAELLAEEAASEAKRVEESARLAAEAEAKEKEVAAELAEASETWAAENSEMLEGFSDSIEQLEAMHDQGPQAMQAAMLPPPPVFSWSALLIEAVFSLLLTVVVLKMAFKWSDIHADWGQMFIPAAADVVTSLMIVALAEVFLGTDHLFHLDHALSYLVLVIVLRKTTHASSLARAVSVAGVAKVASIVLWSILSVLILQSLFG